MAPSNTRPSALMTLMVAGCFLMSGAALAISLTALWQVQQDRTANATHGIQPPATADAHASPPVPITLAPEQQWVPAGRSPLPQPGETVPEPFRYAKGSTQGGDDGPAKPAKLITWDQAAAHVGQRVTVEGTVVAAHNTGTVCFLNFDKQWEGKFYLILFKDVLSAWPQSPDKFFKNKQVRATGRIDLHDGRPQLKVITKGQLKIVDK